MASNMISVNRTLKGNIYKYLKAPTVSKNFFQFCSFLKKSNTFLDVRMEACKKHDYTSLGLLPATSVIIVFHNEAEF